MAKFLRLLLCILSISGLAVGAFLISANDDSLSWANGTAEAKVQWGWWFFSLSLFVFIENIIFGALRFYDRIHREGKDLWPKKRIIKRTIASAIWKPLALLPIVAISLIFIAPKISDQISADAIINNSVISNHISLLETDFKAGKLTADEYITDLIYATYDNQSLPKEYQAKDFIMAPDILSAVSANLDNLSDDVVKLAVETVLLGNIQFDTDASQNVSTAFSPLTQTASALEYQTVQSLNKAKLSNNQNFVVIYTDTGDNKISDKDAEKLCNMLESIASNYKTDLNLNLDYKTLYVSTAGYKTLGLTLEANNIDKNIILEKAMPVYVINPYHAGAESSVLASYVGRDFTSILARIGLKLMPLLGDDGDLGQEMAASYGTAPTIPFIYIDPKNISHESLEVVTAHELGHHYSQERNYTLYDTTGTENDFPDETIPNYLSNLVVKNQPSPKNNFLTDHHNNYISLGTCYRMNEILPEPPAENACHTSGHLNGYAQFSFLQNYREIVPDGHTKILDSINTDDSLEYLMDQAGADNFRKVMKTLSQRNLLNNYNTNGLTATKQPHGETVPCKDFCEQDYVINPVSARYFYFTRQEYKDKIIEFSGKNLDFSLLAKNGPTWELINSSQDQNQFTISPDDEHYLFAMAISNSLDEELDYTLKITDAEAKELLDDDTTSEDGLNLKQLSILQDIEGFDASNFGSINGNCATIHIDSLLDLSSLLIRGIGELGSSLIELTGEDTTELDQAVAQYTNNAADIKANLQFHYLNVCQNTFKNSVSFDAAVNFARKNMPSHIKIFEDGEDSSKIGVYASYNIWNGQSKVYVVIKDPDIPTSLFTISVN